MNTTSVESTGSSTLTAQPAARIHEHQAFMILRFAFVVAPIIAGLDKFFDLLTNWDKYLCPFASRIVGGHTHALMMIFGIVEIIAGIGVALRPRIFGAVVAIWLGLVIINLLLIPGYYDIALRDLGLALGAWALTRLSLDERGA